MNEEKKLPDAISVLCLGVDLPNRYKSGEPDLQCQALPGSYQ